MAPRGNFPSSMKEQFIVRFPPLMLDQLRQRAATNHRTQTNELVATLESQWSSSKEDTQNALDAYDSGFPDTLQTNMPDGMRANIKDLARANGRSMNTQIIAMLALGMSEHNTAALPAEKTGALQSRSKADGYMLRFPPGLRERVRAAAKANDRSLNSEIIRVLEQAFPAPIERIVEAAPEMLEALKSAEAFMAGFEGDELQGGVDERLRAIRAAIQKAEGD